MTLFKNLSKFSSSALLFLLLTDAVVHKIVQLLSLLEPRK